MMICVLFNFIVRGSLPFGALIQKGIFDLGINPDIMYSFRHLLYFQLTSP